MNMNTFKKVLLAGISIVFIIVFSSAAETNSAALGSSSSASNAGNNEREGNGIPAKKLHATCSQSMRTFSEDWPVLGSVDAMVEVGLSCAQHVFDGNQWRRFTSAWK